MPDTSAERQEALDAAVALHQNVWDSDPGDKHQLLRTASAIYDWLIAPVSLVITLGPAVDQTTGKVTGPGGNVMKDTEKAQITVTGSDAKQQPTAVGTDLAITSADTNVATIVTDATGTWVVAGNPGSTTISVDWPDSPNGDLAGTVAVDVTTGDATSLVITLGTPVAQ